MPCCCVPQCSNNTRKGWRLFRIPRETERRKKWCDQIKRDKWQPTRSSYVCSGHFVESCYEQRRADKWKKLRPDAVPTLFCRTAPSGSIKMEEELDQTSVSSPLRNAEFITDSYPDSTMASDDSTCIKEEPNDSSSSQESHGNPSELLTGDYTEVTGMASDLTFIKEEPQDKDSPLFPENHGDDEEDMTAATMVGSASISVKEEPQGNICSYLLAEMHGNSEEVITGDCPGEALTAGVLHIKKEPQDTFDFPTSCSSPLGEQSTEGVPGPALEHDILERANSALVQEQSLAEQNYVQDGNNATSSFQQTSLETRDAQPKLFRCSVCSAAFLKYAHRNAEPDTSTRCDDCVYQALSVRKNVRRRKGKRSYKCGECSRLFVNRCLLERHMIVHTGEKPYRCDVCRHTFSYLEALKAHMREHTGEESFKCEICSMTLSRARDLKRHMTTHNRKKPFKCEACPAAFSRAGDLNRHKRTHTGEKPLKCEVCSATFAWPGQLKKHSLKHTGEKPYRPYKCKLCPADFFDSTNLTNHMRTHTGEKPYKCDLCPAEFSYATNLTHHVRTHTAKKRFKCELCPSAFVQEASLRRHIQTHMGVKPYKCQLCTAAFSRHGQFRSHMLSHIGEKPFKCLFCAAEFTDSSSLESHVVVHKDDDVEV